MDATEISRIIEREIDGDWSRTNDHGVDLRRCLVPPARRPYRDPRRGDRVRQLWLVLVELPEDSAGYRIVFDEETREFGLAVPDREGPDVYIGPMGTFLETLEGM